MKPLLQFINNFGIVTGRMNSEARTDQNEKCEQKFNQSASSQVNEPKSKANKTNPSVRSLPQLNTVDQNTINILQTNHETTMDIRRIEQNETDNPSKETLQLTKQWRELVKPGDYRTSNGVRKKIQFAKTSQSGNETNRIEFKSKKLSGLLWDRMDDQDKEPEEDTTQRKELNRVVGKVRNMPQKQEGEQPETSDVTQEVGSPLETIETESTSSLVSFGVPAINFERYLGTTGVRYIQMGQASHIQKEKKWDLEETVRQAEQKFTTEVKTIATETTNDEKLLKPLVRLGRRTLEQISDEYKPYQKQQSTRFGVVFYDDQNIIPKALSTTTIMLLHKGHAAINKMTAAAKPFWWQRITRDIQQKCDECIACKMAGKNIKAQLRMTEIYYLPPVEKINQEIHLDFIGPIKFKHRRFYILTCKDRYSRWLAASICEAPTEKTAKKLLEQNVTLNGRPQTTRTDKGTAFTGK